MAELVDADHNKIGLQYGLKITYHTGSNPVLTTSLALQNIIRIFKHK